MADKPNDKAEAPVEAPAPAPEAPAPEAPEAPAAPEAAPAAAPAPAAPKQPMDPKKKKKIIIWVIILVILISGGVAAAILIPMFLNVDYEPAFNAVKEIRSDISDIYYGDCDSAISYVKSGYTSIANYSDYVSECIETMNKNVEEKFNAIANSAAIQRDDKLSKLFAPFKAAYDSLPKGDTLTAGLKVYEAWHGFEVESRDVSYISSSKGEEKLTSAAEKAAKYLTDSGVDSLKEYGEKWLEKIKAYIKAYFTYYSAKYNDPSRSSYRDAMTTAKSEYEDVVEAEPDVTEMFKLDFEKARDLRDAYNNLYDGVAEAYKEHQPKTKNCITIYGQEICE